MKSCFSDTGKPRYEIRNAGVANTVLLDPVEFEGAEFVVTSGDYDKLMEKVRIKLTQDGNRRELIYCIWMISRIANMNQIFSG